MINSYHKGIMSSISIVRIILLSIFIYILISSFSIVHCQMEPSEPADVIAIKEGADLVLSCPIVVPDEDMIISWTCDDEPADIKSSRIHVTSAGKLKIHSAKVGDSCNYRCEAADGYGTLSVIMKVIIVDKRLLEKLSASSKQRNLTQFNDPSTNSRGSSVSSRQTHVARGRGEITINRPFSSSSSNNNNNNHNQQVASRGDFEIRVEPANAKIKKNAGFSLECRVRHASHLLSPQIIWLKEFIGRKPNTLNEAHNQNLLLIDGSYYHSLNWPRSITYSKRTGSTNSALLIKQANIAHSGRYVCFAGYPPTIMSTSTNFSTTSMSTNDANLDVVSGDNMAQDSLHSKSVKYRLAQATVSVLDDEQSPFRIEAEGNGVGFNPKEIRSMMVGGNAVGANGFLDNNKSNWIITGPSAADVSNETGAGSERAAPEGLPQSLTIVEEVNDGSIGVGPVFNGSWTRNLTIFLLIACGLLYLIKFLYIRYESSISNYINFSSKTKLHSRRGSLKGARLRGTPTRNPVAPTYSVNNDRNVTVVSLEEGQAVELAANQQTDIRYANATTTSNRPLTFLSDSKLHRQPAPLARAYKENKNNNDDMITTINTSSNLIQQHQTRANFLVTSGSDKSQSGYLLHHLATFGSSVEQDDEFEEQDDKREAQSGHLAQIIATNQADHLYSEIGERTSKVITTSAATTAAKPLDSPSQAHIDNEEHDQNYKVPNSILLHKEQPENETKSNNPGTNNID